MPSFALVFGRFLQVIGVLIALVSGGCAVFFAHAAPLDAIALAVLFALPGVAVGGLLYWAGRQLVREETEPGSRDPKP